MPKTELVDGAKETLLRDAGAECSNMPRRAPMCSVVVPQHPPIMLTPKSPTKPDIRSAMGAACNGYSVRPSTKIGNPAFGTTEIGRSQCLANHSTCGVISAGPVAQFRPKLATGRRRRVEATAEISEPTSSVPVVSTVTETMMGNCSGPMPRASRACKAACTAQRICKGSWQVSTKSASTPPSSRPSICIR